MGTKLLDSRETNEKERDTQGSGAVHQRQIVV
jgi:hypothetical protein